MDYVTVKLHANTRRLLRLIAAQTGEQMVQVMERLCQEEWATIAPSNVAASVAKQEPAPAPPRQDAADEG
jgi:hypothetical protein